MSFLSIYKRCVLPKDMTIGCEMGGKQETPGFVGTYTCNPRATGLSVEQLQMRYEARYPDPLTLCGGGDREVHPSCYVRAPAASHPGVIMIDDFFYTLRIDMVF